MNFETTLEDLLDALKLPTELQETLTTAFRGAHIAAGKSEAEFDIFTALRDSSPLNIRKASGRALELDQAERLQAAAAKERPVKDAPPPAPVAPTMPTEFTIKQAPAETAPEDMTLSQAIHARDRGDLRPEILDRIGVAAAELQRQGKLPKRFLVPVDDKIDPVATDQLIRYHAKGNQPEYEVWKNTKDAEVRPITFEQYTKEEYAASPYGERLMNGMDTKRRKWEEKTTIRGRMVLAFALRARLEGVPTNPDDGYEQLSRMGDNLAGTRFERFAQIYDEALKDRSHEYHPVARDTDLVYHEVPAATQPSRPAQPAQPAKPQYQLVLIDEYETEQYIASQPGDDAVIQAAINAISELQLQKAGFGLFVPAYIVTNIRENLKLINQRRRAICGVPDQSNVVRVSTPADLPQLPMAVPVEDPEVAAEKFVRSRGQGGTFGGMGQNVDGVYSRLSISGMSCTVNAIVTSYATLSGMSCTGILYKAPGAEAHDTGSSNRVRIVQRTWSELAELCRSNGW